MKTTFFIIVMAGVALLSFKKTEPKFKSENAIIQSQILIQQADKFIKNDSIKLIYENKRNNKKVR